MGPAPLWANQGVRNGVGTRGNQPEAEFSGNQAVAIGRKRNMQRNASRTGSAQWPTQNMLRADPPCVLAVAYKAPYIMSAARFSSPADPPAFGRCPPVRP